MADWSIGNKIGKGSFATVYSGKHKVSSIDLFNCGRPSNPRYAKSHGAYFLVPSERVLRLLTRASWYQCLAAFGSILTLSSQ